MAERGQSTALRLSLQFAFLYATLSALVFAGAYLWSQYEVRDLVRDRMRSNAGDLERVFKNGGPVALAAAVAVLSEMNFEAERIFLLIDAEGTNLAGNVLGVPPQPPDYLGADLLELPSGADEEVLGYWMRSDRIGDMVLVQGTSDHSVFEILEALGISLALGFLALLAAGVAAGVWVGRLTGDRVSAISSALDLAGAGALDARVKGADSAPRDDLGTIARSVNRALARIEALLNSQEQITTDIAHDLRTPMQRLRQRIEGMSPEDPGARDGALAEIDAILQTFRALLRIAQVRGRDSTAGFAPVDLGALLREVVELYMPLAEEARLALSVHVPAGVTAVLGDRRLITQLLANLVENAIQHASGGTAVRVGADDNADAVRVWVEDDGPGIPAGEREAVFRRFYRLDRSRRTRGNGLGLAMVRAIAELHGGHAAIVESALGVRAEVTFGRRH